MISMSIYTLVLSNYLVYVIGQIISFECALLKGFGTMRHESELIVLWLPIAQVAFFFNINVYIGNPKINAFYVDHEKCVKALVPVSNFQW